MTKTQIISAAIAKHYAANGGDIAKAFDAVLGHGAYLKLAGDIYNTLRTVR